ncbi:hypothetical protein GIY56_13120 [Paracoccus sp. YIM 132242]|uniref:Uncharacterized protein n=1 Tax=Paracoccus lichenicola TaxID=2665644 RepID=A0A6L6HPX8_9RHOB|nr:hypothetical protein [Paracoccus lichenicola]MTE01224.1 hypothetical protein [Paracoccus lichenicola]
MTISFNAAHCPKDMTMFGSIGRTWRRKRIAQLAGGNFQGSPQKTSCCSTHLVSHPCEIAIRR